MATNLKAGAAINAHETAVANSAACVKSIKSFYRDEIGGELTSAILLRVRAIAAHADEDKRPYPDLRCVVLVNGQETEQWINGYELSNGLSFAYGEGYKSDVVGKLSDVYAEFIDAHMKLKSPAILDNAVRTTVRAKHRQAIADADDPDALINEFVAEEIEHEKEHAKVVQDTAAFRISCILRGIEDANIDDIPEKAPVFKIIQVSYKLKLGDKLPGNKCEYAKDRNGDIMLATKDWKNAQSKCVYTVPAAEGLDELHKALIVKSAVICDNDIDLDALLAE